VSILISGVTIIIARSTQLADVNGREIPLPIREDPQPRKTPDPASGEEASGEKEIEAGKPLPQNYGYPSLIS